jgi:hypothetical protein
MRRGWGGGGQANSCDIIHTCYSITWPPVYTKFWPQFHIQCHEVLYKFSNPMLANLKSCRVFVAHCTLVKIVTHYQNYLLPTQRPSLFHKYGQKMEIFYRNPITLL